eukprot:gene6741-4860_t
MWGSLLRNAAAIASESAQNIVGNLDEIATKASTLLESLDQGIGQEGEEGSDAGSPREKADPPGVVAEANGDDDDLKFEEDEVADSPPHDSDEPTETVDTAILDGEQSAPTAAAAEQQQQPEAAGSAYQTKYETLLAQHRSVTNKLKQKRTEYAQLESTLGSLRASSAEDLRRMEEKLQ